MGSTLSLNEMKQITGTEIKQRLRDSRKQQERFVEENRGPFMQASEVTERWDDFIDKIYDRLVAQNIIPPMKICDCVSKDYPNGDPLQA